MFDTTLLKETFVNFFNDLTDYEEDE